MARISSLVVRTLLDLLYTALVSLLVLTTARADDPVVRFNLPAEPLPRALIDFYHQSGIEPGFAPTSRMEKATSHPVSGVMASSEALALLLKDTGYTFQFDTADAVDIIPAGRPADGHAVAAERVVGAHARPSPPAAVARERRRLDEVDVTGSLIPGVQDAVAPVIYLKRRQLAMSSYPTIQDALYSLPMISLNGPREDLGIDGNNQYGAGLDLRGLGVGATLVLVNGHRQPLSGLNGDFVDVSTIPLSAVKRIEVLPDGASAIYGSDAIAGVINIIMRNDFQGAESKVTYGTAIGGRRDITASQLLGTRWSSGHAMLAYEYSDATPLAASQRPYAANADKTPYGGANYDSYYSNPGNILNPATQLPAYGIPAGQNGRSLTAAALSTSINLENPFSRYQIFPDVTANELYGTAAENIDRRLQIYFEGRFAARDVLQNNFPQTDLLPVPASNPFYVNPFGNVPFTLVSYSFSRDFGPTVFSAKTQVYTGTAGVKWRLGSAWQATLSESYGRQTLLTRESNVPDAAALAASLADPNPTTAFNPFGDGSNTNPATLAAIRHVFPLHVMTSIESTRLVGEGPVFRMPAGEAKLAVGVERREEALFHDVADPLDPAGQTVPQRYSRHITALFSQLALPLIGNPAGSRAVPRLDLNLAGRYEHYSDFGGTFNPTVRIQWVPLQTLKLRASWGRSFRAPTLDNLYDTAGNASGLVVLPDPASPTGRSLALIEQGSNPGLKQETADTWTAGFDFAPDFLAAATFSLTYYSIDYRNRIAQPAADNPFTILVNAAEWAPVITRNPSPAQVAAVCNNRGYRYQGSASECLASSPAEIVDGRLANLATTRTTGLDLEAKDTVSGALGTLDLGVTANYVIAFEQSVTAASPALDIVNTIDNPLALRLRGLIGWRRSGPGLPGPGFDLAINHTGGYRNPSSALLPHVSPWTTVDARFFYRTGADAGWLSGLELSVNVVNVLNHDPPFVDDIFGYDVFNVQALGRVVSASIDKRW
ncbi:MAG TPA: TonB-dependent receptor [Steroidobacteraceae bacterium]|nr:TonB-dependent receptor [Steroidobacteraceae bacterium]